MRNLPEITGLRGLAALYVLLLHIVVVLSVNGIPSPGPLAWMSFGWIGVDLFFVLSGFLLALPLLAKPAQMRAPGFWRLYIAKRWWRIAPPYYVSIIVALVLSNQLTYLVTEPADIVLHLTFLHSFWIQSFGSIVPVYWTLASEFQFYLLLPAFVLLLRSRTWALNLAAMAVVTLVWRALTYNGPGAASLLSFTLPAFVLHFALGILAARLFLSGYRARMPARFTIPLVVVLFIALPLMLLGTTYGSQGDSTLIANILLRPLLAVGFAILVFLICSDTSRFNALLGSRPARALGVQSYSLYLIHVPVLVLLTQWSALDGYGFWVLAPLGLVASLAAGAAFYLLVERPSLAAREWFTTRRTPSRAPAPHVDAQAPTAVSAA